MVLLILLWFLHTKGKCMKLWVILPILLLFSGNAIAQSTTDQEPQDKPSGKLANWIMHLVVNKGEENEQIKRDRITYNKKVVKYDLKKTPPQIIETSIYQIFGDGGKSLERLIEKNGKLIKNDRPKPGKLSFNEILLERYNFNLEKEELIDGRGYYVISFKPKEPMNRLPINDRMDEGVNRTAGILYVDMEKFYLKRMEGNLTKNFSKALGIFEMRDFSIIFEQEEFEEVIVPSSIVVTYKFNIVLWGETYEKLEYSYSDRKTR